MILRILVFAVSVLIFIFIGLVLIKDLGENRVKVEKRTKLEKLNSSDQVVWQKGSKPRK